MKRIFVTIMLLVYGFANAQMSSTATVNEYNLQTIVAEVKQQKYTEGVTNKDEYFDVNFLPASIDGFKEKENFRYNALLDDLEFLRDGYLYKMNKSSNQIIRFDNGKVLKYVSYIDGDTLTSRYLQVLSPTDQKVVLYRKFSIDGVDGLGAGGLNASNKRNYFKQDKLLIGYNDKMYNVPNSPKKFKDFTDKDVNAIVSTNKLNLKKEQDLIKLIDLLNK
ncbi:hypothetical protein HXZ94_00880 [Empedobacter falsenii]|uniref:hypothetical protein n=1 Tax=Empedobacter falsenii TaxID=343874 RepID=UPI00257652D9|nr:hypothetical protein [Empedobacter falsenii]MDM1297060.1 hypothetical protein [Empedobacter falsenii]MDM1316853.1 hypothetical protein [Empedobacter falsenii]